MERKSLCDDTALNYDTMHLFKIDVVLAATYALSGRVCSALECRRTLCVDPGLKVMHDLALAVV
jgi:hypothetical protein